MLWQTYWPKSWCRLSIISTLVIQNKILGFEKVQYEKIRFPNFIWHMFNILLLTSEENWLLIFWQGILLLSNLLKRMRHAAFNIDSWNRSFQDHVIYIARNEVWTISSGGFKWFIEFTLCITLFVAREIYSYVVDNRT